MIQLRNICLSFGSQKIFDNLSMNIVPDQRLGLVGRNGSGKSTLLKAIEGLQHLDSGSIGITGGMQVVYMPQEVVLTSAKTILEEALSSYKEVGPLRERALHLEPLVENKDLAALEEYAQVVERLSELNVEYAIAETKKMLLGLGFKQEQFDKPVSTLSVGWQMRVVLAKLLLQKADFYLFDEPTNHLDIVAKDWFLDFLSKMDCGFMIVCHDKYFLDKLCNIILELDRGNGTVYHGNYADYESQKEARLQAIQQAYAMQKKEIDQKKELIARFKATASKAKMAQSLQKALDKVEIIEVPPSARAVRFNFPPTERPGRVVLEVHALAFAFNDKKIFEHVSFQIERGEKVALVAANGVGKTTLFNVICGKYKATHGTVQFGSNVKRALFEQDQNRVLDPRKTVIEEVYAHVANKTEQEIRSFLGAFLFGKEEIQKKTSYLSGGEKNRLSMVKVLLQDANFLLLDEPTNHLDIPSKETLLRALQQFDGTLLFVSHDHDFINNLATRVIELTFEGVHSYIGNYDLYHEQKLESEKLKNNSAAYQSFSETTQKVEGSEKSGKIAHNLKKDQQRLEAKIARLEQSLNELNASFADAEYGTAEFKKITTSVKETEKELALVQAEWEAVMKKYLT